MEVTVERVVPKPVTPIIKSVTLTLTPEEAVILREVGNWSSYVARKMGEQATVKCSAVVINETLRALWAALKDAGVPGTLLDIQD